MLKKAKALKAKAAATKASSNISPVIPPRAATQQQNLPNTAMNVTVPSCSETVSDSTQPETGSRSSEDVLMKPIKLVPTRKIADKPGNKNKGVPLSIQLSDQPLPLADSSQTTIGAKTTSAQPITNLKLMVNVRTSAQQSVQTSTTKPTSDNLSEEKMDVDTVKTDLKLLKQTTKQTEGVSSVQTESKALKLAIDQSHSPTKNQAEGKQSHASTVAILSENQPPENKVSSSKASEVKPQQVTVSSAEEAAQIAALEREIQNRKSIMLKLKKQMEQQHEVKLESPFVVESE